MTVAELTTSAVRASPSRARALRRRLVLALALALAGVVALQVLSWPDVARLGREDPSTTAFMERARAAIEHDGETLEWEWVPYEQISPELKRAVLAAEDARFAAHGGFDEVEIRAAAREAFRERRMPRGASTITQQLARNLWLSPSQNPLRKVKEGILTWQLERALPKRRILELYLNVAQFGPNVFGAQAAAQWYFGVAASELSAAQGARLAAGLAAPALWNAWCISPECLDRARLVEGRMRGVSLAGL